MLIQQAILLALGIAGGLIWWSYDYGGVNATPLWMPAILVWISQSMFWFGWFTRDLKLLLYLAGAWVGVMAALAVVGTFVGGGVAASADVTWIRAALRRCSTRPAAPGACGRPSPGTGGAGSGSTPRPRCSPRWTTRPIRSYAAT